MRAALAAKAVERAREQATRLGIELTDDQAEAAGAELLRNEQRDRMAAARVHAAAAKADAKRRRDLEWGIRQVHVYATSLHTWAPTVPDSEQTRICLMAFGDELRAPDGFSRPRLIKRLEALRQYVMEQAAARSRELAVPWDAEGIEELIESADKPDSGRRIGLVADLPEDEQRELLDLYGLDGAA